MIHDEKTHIIYDLDDTLADFTDGFVHFMQTQILNVEPCKIDWPPQYHLMAPFAELTHLTAEEALLLYEKSGTMKEMRPTALADMYRFTANNPNYIATVLTARGWMKDPATSVKEWFDHWDLPQPDLVKIVQMKESKSRWVAGLEGSVCAIFDDNPHHLEAYMKDNPKGAIIFAADRPWNQTSPCHTRLNTVQLIGEHTE